MNTFSRAIVLILSILALSVHSATAQEHEQATAVETKAEVPALTKFHTTIYKLWHTAWPKKDTAMLVALVPDIEKGVAEVAAAELPGILRDKKTVWDTNVNVLREVAAEYTAAASGSDKQRLLDAAEKLHSQYETLMRVVRPPMKQIDAFHSVLYMIYHYYMPEWNMSKLKTSVAELKVKMDTLNVAKLSERQKKREEAFLAARQKLSISVDEVVAAVATEDKDKIKKAITAMHSNYEALEKVFE